jgi:hypothetical protein
MTSLILDLSCVEFNVFFRLGRCCLVFAIIFNNIYYYSKLYINI